MNTRRTTFLIALVLAVGTGLLTLNYVHSVQQSAKRNMQLRTVIVAMQNIPPRERITARMLQPQTRPVSAVDPDAISDESKAIGALSLITIPKGSILTASKIGSPRNPALPVRLTPGMRAVSIHVDQVKDVSGLIQPGDRVDVIAVPPRTGNVPPPAATILRGVRVLAIGPQLEHPSATPPPSEENPTTATLEVTPKQADLLTFADVNATLRLALRSPQEPINSYDTEPLRFGRPETAAAAPPVVAAPALAIAPPGAGTAPARARGRVVLIDGDRITDSTSSGSAAPALR